MLRSVPQWIPEIEAAWLDSGAPLDLTLNSLNPGADSNHTLVTLALTRGFERFMDLRCQAEATAALAMAVDETPVWISGHAMRWALENVMDTTLLRVAE